MPYHAIILWCIFPTNKNILKFCGTTIIIKKFKIMHYCYLILLDQIPIQLSPNVRLYPLQQRVHARLYTVLSCCFFSCLWSGAILQSFLELYYLNTQRPVIFVNWIFLIFPYDYIKFLSCRNIEVMIYTFYCVLSSESWFQFISLLKIFTLTILLVW